MASKRRRYDITEYQGNYVNKWKILETAPTALNGEKYWYCECQCGLVKSIRVYVLLNQISKSCQKCRGQASKNANSPYWKGGEFVSHTIYHGCKMAAKRRKIAFNISISDLENKWKKQEGKCAYTKINLTLPIHNRLKNYNASIDRIDSKKGYEIDNIQWVLKEVNLMKMDIEERRFLELCKIINNENKY